MDDNENTLYRIDKVCASLAALLKYKNVKYGDAALNPMRIFSKADAENSIAIRLDDKLARIKNGSELRKNDLVDVLGYGVLMAIGKGWFDFDEFQD